MQLLKNFPKSLVAATARLAALLKPSPRVVSLAESVRTRITQLATRVVTSPRVAALVARVNRRTARLVLLVKRLGPRRFPIAHKLAVVFTLLITGGMLALGALVVRDQTQLLRTQMGEFGNTVAQQMAESAKEQLLADDLLGLQSTLNNLIGKGSVLGAVIYSEEEYSVVQAGLVPDIISLRTLAVSGRAHEWVSNDAEGHELALASFVAPVVFEDVVVGFALVTFDRTLMEGAEKHTIRSVIWATVALVLIGIGASVWLGKRLTRPIDQIMDVSRAISAGNYKIRFEERRNDELGLLMESMNAMSEGLLRKEQVENTFSRYVSPRVAKEVLDHMETVQLGGRHVQASVLFADIVGFTSMSEHMEPAAISELLNEYFTHIAHAAEAFNGHVDKYIGDCAMLVFGVPIADPDHAFHAVACGVAIHRVVERLNAQRVARGLVPVQFRIGINSGMMLAGNMGSSKRMEYTVVGDAVNLASRLASVGEPGQIVITAEMHDAPYLIGRVKSRELDTIPLRGKRLPVATFQITDLAEDYQGLLEAKVTAILHEEAAA